MGSRIPVREGRTAAVRARQYRRGKSRFAWRRVGDPSQRQRCRRAARDRHCPRRRFVGFSEAGEPTPEQPTLKDKLRRIEWTGGCPWRGTLSQRRLQESPEPLYPQRDSEVPSVAHAPKPDIPPRSTWHRPCSRGCPGFESTISSERVSPGSWKPPPIKRSPPLNKRIWGEKTSPKGN